MNIIQPIANIMSTKLVTANPEDPILKVKEIFDKHKIHHIPVVRYKEIVGMISKSDFLHFLRGYKQNDSDGFIEDARLRAFHAKEIMTTGLAKVESRDPIRTALEVFKENLFHALPVVDDGELVGLITTLDIIKELAKEPIKPEDYK